MCNVLQEVMLPLLPNEVIGEKLDAHIANYSNTNVAAQGVLREIVDLQLIYGSDWDIR